MVDEPSKSSLCSVKNVDDFDDEFCGDDDRENTTRLLRLPPLFAKCAPLCVVVVAEREFKRSEAMMRARVCR